MTCSFRCMAFAVWSVSDVCTSGVLSRADPCAGPGCARMRGILPCQRVGPERRFTTIALAAVDSRARLCLESAYHIATAGYHLHFHLFFGPKFERDVFTSRRRHTRSLCDWSSDVCSSD